MNKYEQLSLEEELDVLLPVYMLGASKGWEFLTSEQVKKLVDGGKIKFTDTGELEELGSERIKEFRGVKRENVELMVDMFMSTLVDAFEKALIEQLEYCSLEEWENKDKETKWAVDKLVFYMTFGIKLDELPNRILNVFSGIEQGII